MTLSCTQLVAEGEQASYSGLCPTAALNMRASAMRPVVASTRSLLTPAAPVQAPPQKAPFAAPAAAPASAAGKPALPAGTSTKAGGKVCSRIVPCV